MAGGCAWTFVVVHAELCCTTSSIAGWIWAVAACFRVVVDVEGFAAATSLDVGCSVGEVGFCSCVVSLCLEIVLMSRWVCALEVVVCPARTMTTTSMLRLGGSVECHQQVLLY